METETNSTREMPQSDPAESRISLGKKIDVTKVVITLLLVLLTAGAVGGGTYYVLSQNMQKEREANEKTIKELQEKALGLKEEKTEKTQTKEANSTNSSSNLLDSEIRNILDGFETAQKIEDPSKTLSYLSHASNSSEGDFYNFLTGKDVSVNNSSYRLFGTATFSYKVTSYKVVSQEKTDVRTLKVIVEEDRSVYNNVTTTWTPIVKNKVLIFSNIEGGWLLDKYYNQNVENNSDVPGTLKYNGFYS